MSYSEKAKQFMEDMNEGDPRCQILLMMLTISFGITEHECIERIKQLVEQK